MWRRATRFPASGAPVSDLLIINEIDLAPFVRADLAVMDRDARAVRGGRPFALTNCFSGDGLGEVMDRIEQVIRRQFAAPTSSSI
jgi:urease accessory protein